MTSASVYIASPAATDTRQPNVVKTGMELIAIDQIDSATENHWLKIRNANPALQSGYYHPEFFRAVSRVRDDVRLAVVYEEDIPVSILPFQQSGRRVATPAGGMMNDFHGIISESGKAFDVVQFLNESRISRFDFHALNHGNFGNHSDGVKLVFRTLECPWIDLSQGTFSYQEWSRNHSSTIRRQPQKTRAMTRQFGPVRLEFDIRDPEVLETAIRWKREKFKRTRTFDLLGVPWTSNLLREVFNSQEDGFRGILSGLYAGDKLVAAHFGFISGSILHYWFPTYDHDLNRYSPGTLLLIEIAAACAEQSITQIDLSYGESPLKDRFANRSSQVEVGCLSRSGLTRSIAERRYQARQLAKRIPLKEQTKRILRTVYPGMGQGQFR